MQLGCCMRYIKLERFGLRENSRLVWYIQLPVFDKELKRSAVQEQKYYSNRNLLTIFAKLLQRDVLIWVQLKSS